MGVVCVVLLTSSQNHSSRVSSGPNGHGMSSRDRILVSVDDDHGNDHRQDTAACVSLSKSTMSKTRTTFAEPAVYARRRRGAGCLSAPYLTVNRLTQHPKYARMRAQKSPRGCGDNPHQSVAIRLKARKLGQPVGKFKDKSYPRSNLRAKWPAAFEGGL
jgi:hypothetical protein